MLVYNATALDARRRLLRGAHLLIGFIDGHLSEHKYQPNWRRYGLCENLKRLGGVYDEYDEYGKLRGAATHELHSAFETWDKWSGDHLYPVPSCDDEFDENVAYNIQEDMYEGDYGELRIDLLRHLIAHWESMDA